MHLRTFESRPGIQKSILDLCSFWQDTVRILSSLARQWATAGGNLPKAYEVTITQLEIGISLSRKNALRLAHDAEVLLAQGASRASVYAQWHLAVEELGKSSILEGCRSIEGSHGRVRIPARIFSAGSHKKKFSAGLTFLPETKKRGFAFSVTIETNRSAVITKLQDPHGGKGQIAAGSGSTGLFADVTPGSGIEPSHDLRLRLLYVDFDGTRWWEPEMELKNSEIMAKTVVSPGDLKRAIDELLTALSIAQS